MPINKDRIIRRINDNEKKLDNIIPVIQKIDMDLNSLSEIKKDINDLKKYYGSKNWFKDFDSYNNGDIPKVKAGVLSEDTIWNLERDLNELAKRMQRIAKWLLEK